MKILVVRPDRLGDVILSTPVFEVLRRHYPESHLSLLVRENVTPLLKGLPSLDQILIFDPDGRHAGVKGFFRLRDELRVGQFDIAVVLQSHWKVALALFMARVRHRVGPLSKIYSYLLYNRGVRQRRSQVEMHEADYNLQLLRTLGIQVSSRSVETRIFVSEEMQKPPREWLKKQGWRSEPLILIHPGMGGSALNWPEAHYVELIRALLQEGRSVLITGGPLEEGLLNQIRHELSSSSRQPYYYLARPGDTIDFLAGLCMQAHVVVAPSTGPLHLAVALAKKVVTFYPPIRVQSALRWGPYLFDETKASVLVPEVYCGEDFHCKGNLCNYFPCMKSLTVKQALRQVDKYLET